MIELRGVSKHYLQGGTSYPVLHDLSLTINKGEFVAIVGPSGNGKTTLLNLMTGIDHASAGSVIVNGTHLGGLSNERLTVWRRTNVGIVFQFFQLLPTLSLLQNVMLPMDFRRRLSRRQRRERALRLLEAVGLQAQAERLPSQVSGGQQQRAALARALANNPPIIIADEPTGNLDSATAESVFELLKGLHHYGKTLVMVTHNEVLAEQASRKIEIRAGRIHETDANSFADAQVINR